MWDFSSTELGLHTSGHISGRRRSHVCRIIFQVIKSCFQGITLFLPPVPAQLLQSNGLRGITVPQKQQERKMHQCNPGDIKSLAQAGLWSEHQWRSEKRNQESGVDVAGWKEFPRSCPLLTQPGHPGETGGSLQQWVISLFPGYCSMMDPDPHGSHSCSIT